MTALTCDGLIIVSSLPRPQCDWLELFLAGQELYVGWNHEEGYLIDLETLEFMLRAAGVGLCEPLPN